MRANEESTIGAIVRLFEVRGDSAYGREAVSQREHALQTAERARAEGSSAAMIVAALLHDVGHLLHDLDDDAPEAGVDDRHEELGCAWLGRWFGAAVVEPVRLHVAAKQYLCLVEPGYWERLSEPSRVSLALQGGVMTAEEARAFESLPHANDAVALRRWDDAAKERGKVVPLLGAHMSALREALRSCPA